MCTHADRSMLLPFPGVHRPGPGANSSTCSFGATIFERLGHFPGGSHGWSHGWAHWLMVNRVVKPCTFFGILELIQKWRGHGKNDGQMDGKMGESMVNPWWICMSQTGIKSVKKGSSNDSESCEGGLGWFGEWPGDPNNFANHPAVSKTVQGSGPLGSENWHTKSFKGSFSVFQPTQMEVSTCLNMFEHVLKVSTNSRVGVV